MMVLGTNSCCVPSEPLISTCPGQSSWRKKRESQETISFWLCSVISLARASASEEDCQSLRVRAHEVRKVVMSLLFKRDCVVH